MFGSDYSLWITLKLPWAKSCGSPVELQRMRKHKRQHSAKSGKMVSNFKLQSCKVSSVLNPTMAYMRQIAHWSIIRTSCVFILCLFSGNFECVLLLYSKQAVTEFIAVTKFITITGKKNWKVAKLDVYLHRLVRTGDAVALKMSGGSKCHRCPPAVYRQSKQNQKQILKDICMWSRPAVGY